MTWTREWMDGHTRTMLAKAGAGPAKLLQQLVPGRAHNEAPEWGRFSKHITYPTLLSLIGTSTLATSVPYESKSCVTLAKMGIMRALSSSSPGTTLNASPRD
jgi:hypothetical protein